MMYSRNVLTVGCECLSPQGGVAGVLNTYMRFVYDPFIFVANSCEGSKLKKLFLLLVSYLKCERIERIHSEIKIVHIHTASYNSFLRSSYFIRQAKRNGKKVICHIHGGGFKQYREQNPKIVDKVLDKCDALITLSESWKMYFISCGFQNVFVVNNIIEEPVKIQIKKDDKLHLLFLGHITQQKGVYDLLDVINQNKVEWRGRIVLHIGGSKEVDRLNKLIESYDIGDMVIFEGWVFGKKKIELFNLSDAFILPSYVEGLPVSILEALSYGLPILSTNIGAIPEVVKQGKTGILFEPGDLDGISNAISYLISDKGFRGNAFECAQIDSRCFLPSEVSLQLENVYQCLI